MVQVLPAYNPWESVNQALGTGFEAFKTRHDENALQSALGGLGPNATAREILDAITNTRTYSPKAKQAVLENYMGAAKFEEAKRQHKEQTDLLKARNEIAQAKQQQQVDKVASDKAAARGIGKALGLSDEVADALTLPGAESLLKEDLKQKNKPSDVDKRLREKTIDEYIDLTKDIESLSKTNELIEDVEKDVAEMERAPVSSYVGGKIGTKWATQLEAKSLPIIQPTLKLLAPSGPIIKAKLELAKDLLHIKATDFPWQARGKIEAAKKLNKIALSRAKERKTLIEETDFNPRNERVSVFDNETAGMVDAVLDLDFEGKELNKDQTKNLNLPSPSKRKGKTIRSPDGTRYYSDGEKWIVK